MAAADSPASPVPQPRRRGWRAAVLGLLAILVLIALADAGLWYYATNSLRDGIGAWIEARRQEGYTVEAGAITTGGFPFRARATVADPAIASPPGPFAWDWRPPALTLEAPLWALNRFVGHLPGSHQFTVIEQDRKSVLAVDAAVFDVAFVRPTPAEEKGAPAVAAKVHGEGLTVAADQGPAAKLGGLDAVVTAYHPEAPDHLTETYDLDATVTAITLPNEPPPALGRDIARVLVRAAIMGRIPPAALPAQSLALWRDDGGTIEARRVELDYGPLEVRGEGTLALDRALQPVGALTARIDGVFETVDALRDRGLMREQEATTAKMLLGALSKRIPDQAPGLNVPLTIQERRLVVGPVPIWTIPELRW
jgi:hypothetical protein